MTMVASRPLSMCLTPWWGGTVHEMAKPAHLTPEVAAQFADRAVVEAYRARPPYPVEVFALLESLLTPGGSGRVLELGCGSGDLTLGLAPRVTALDALELSAPMLEVARLRAGASHSRVTWISGAVESFAPRAKYSLVVAAESLHWMDWHVVLPRCAEWLEPGGVLAIVDGRTLERLPWQDEQDALVRTHSTTRNFQRFDLVDELTRRGLFRGVSRRLSAPEPFEQSVSDYVESFHSRNGFSRERMTAESAAAFDDGLRSAALRHFPNGVIRTRVSALVVWGQPLSG